MDNRFLKRLQIGLLDLQKNPSGLEVTGIPRSSFEIFVKIFRHGLPPEIQQGLPPHNLADKEYLRLLAFQVESFLKKPAPEVEKIFSNMPPLANLELAYQKAHERQANALTQHQSWQTTFSQQIKKYNLDLEGRLDLQLQKEFPSLAKNPGKRKILVADMTQTIQTQGLPAMKGDYEVQTRDVLQEVTRKTLKQYATEIEELQTEKLASQPQAREEKINAVAETIAKEQAETTLAIRRNQIRAETSPGADPVYKIKSVVETSIMVNLPPELAEDPKLVEAVTEEMMGRIHMAAGSSEKEYQEYVAQQIKIVLTRSKVAKILEQKKLASAQIEKMAETLATPLAEEISPEIYQVASSPAFGQTPFAGSTAGFIPWGTSATAGSSSAGAAPTVQIIPPTPPIPPVAPVPPVTPIAGAPGPAPAAAAVTGPSVGIPGIGGSGLSVVGYVGKDTPLELLQADGSPLHFLTALTSPHGAADFGKYLLTLGPLRSTFWFLGESFGLVKPDYMQIGLFSLDQMFSGLYVSLYGETPDGRAILDKKKKPVKGLYEKLAAASGHEKYVLGRETKEVEKRFNFVKQFYEGIHNNPALDKAYNLFFGEQGKILGKIDTSNWIWPFKNMTLGGYHLLHPWQAFTSNLYQRNIFLGLGVSGFFDSLSAYAKYGGYGGAYVSGEYVKMFGAYLVKVAGAKLGLYEVIGEGLHRRYVFKPLYKVQLWVQHGLSAAVKGTAKAVATQLSKSAAGKAFVGFVAKAATWIGTRVGSLVSVVASWVGIALLVVDLIKIVWAWFKKMLKWTAAAFAALMLWLFANFSLPEIILSMAGGIPVAVGLTPLLQPFFGIFTFPVGWMIGTFNSALIIKGFKSVFGSIGQGIGSFANNLFNFTGNLLHGLTGGITSGLVGMVAPVLTITGGILGFGYFYMNMVTSSAFWLPSQISQVQSSYFEVKKSASFSGKVGEPIKYTLLIGVKTDKKDSKLINIKISDKTDASCQGQPPTIAERNFPDKIPANITLTSPLTIEYSVPTDNSFNDCLITNTATVTADVENGPGGEESFYTASVTIGNPPVSVPSLWPLASGCITQGPEGSTSHAAYHEEAIDIDSAASGKPALVTHNGTVIRAVSNQSASTTGYGNYVIVSGNGPSSSFTTIYAHLQAVLVSAGQKVTAGQTIGRVGGTGNADAPHLHYEFTNLKMVPPYLPKDISNIRSCSSRATCNLCFP